MKKLTTIFVACLCLMACSTENKDNADNNQKVATTHKFDSIAASNKKIADSIANVKVENSRKVTKTETIGISSLDTTVTQAGYTFTFSEISKATFEQNFRYSNPTSKQYHQLCSSIPNKTYPAKDCADTIEALQLKKHQDIIQAFPIEGEAIEDKRKTGKRFAFGVNKQFRLADNVLQNDGANSHYFREVISFDDHPYFVFFRQNWEGANYLMVSGKTGKDLVLNGIPQISPDKAYIFTTPYDASTYFNFGGIELWNIVSSKLSKVLRLNLDNMGNPWRAYWVDANTVMFEVIENIMSENNTYRYGKMHLRKLPKN